MTPPLQRAHLLLQQERYDQAARELRQALVHEPDSPLAHAWLALCLSGMKQPTEALREAQQAVALGPAYPYAHFVLARVLDDQDRLKEAERSVREAIRLDPEEADYWAQLSGIVLQQQRWREALETADRGLSLDSEHVGCANLRSIALVQMGRRDEAARSIHATLALDPENATSHANQGWALLHRNDHPRAMEHFREALRLEPNHEWARRGIVEAMKARNLLYRPLLRYFLWMGRLSGRAQWAFILGLWFGARIVREVARANPSLRPYLMPVGALYLLFVFLTWTADPLFNLLLRLDPLGRHALTKRQIAAANAVGACLLAALAGLIAWAVTGAAAPLVVTGGGLLLMIPISATYNASTPTAARVLGALTLLLGLVLALAFVLLAFENLEAAAVVGALFFLGVVAFTWLAGAVRGRG